MLLIWYGNRLISPSSTAPSRNHPQVTVDWPPTGRPPADSCSCCGDEPRCRRLDAALELGHHGAAGEAGLDRRQDLDDDAARSLVEAAAAPEDAGIDRHRHQLQA